MLQLCSFGSLPHLMKFTETIICSFSHAISMFILMSIADNHKKNKENTRKHHVSCKCVCFSFSNPVNPLTLNFFLGRVEQCLRAIAVGRGTFRGVIMLLDGFLFPARQPQSQKNRDKNDFHWLRNKNMLDCGQKDGCHTSAMKSPLSTEQKRK